MAETEPTKSSRPRRRRWRTVLLALAAMLVTLATYTYFHTWRLSTRGTPLAAGTVAADFTLPDHSGGTVSLAALTAKGPAVLVFYRGFW
ncbi:MAG TPA: hypothetical protein VGL81_10565 [Polyangiaceae bacterium]|jgi:hypothetical protein